MTVYEVEDPETHQKIRLMPVQKEGGVVWQRGKPSVHELDQMTAPELEARAAFAAGAARAFGEKAEHGQNPTWAPIREEEKVVAAANPDPHRSKKVRDERARQQELYRMMLPDDVRRRAEGLAPLKVKQKKVKVPRRSARAPGHIHPTVEEAGPLSSIPMPPF